MGTKNKSLSLLLTISIVASNLLIIQLATAQVQTTESYSDNFSKDSGLWTYLGNAYLNQTNQNIVLTDPAYCQAGVAFFNYPVSALSQLPSVT